MDYQQKLLVELKENISKLEKSGLTIGQEHILKIINEATVLLEYEFFKD